MHSFAISLSNITIEDVDALYFAFEDQVKSGQTVPIESFYTIMVVCTFLKDLERSFATLNALHDLKYPVSAEAYNYAMEVKKIVFSLKV